MWASEMMKRTLPRRYSPYIYGVIQSALTTGVATGIATYKLTATPMEFVMYWMTGWSLSWLAMLPIVVLVSPIIQSAVGALTDNGNPDLS